MNIISITGYSSISALGNSSENIWNSYKKENHLLTNIHQKNVEGLVSKLSYVIEDEIQSLKKSNSKYQALDKSVLMAIYVGRIAVKNANWGNDSVFGINIGSSRGATGLFEEFYDDFSNNELGKTHPLTSPTTTLGNLSTWLADDLQSTGPTISHSITCSTGLHAVLNGVAWINSGMSERFMVGATEAPNTAFTIAQMQAIKIYTDNNNEYPCRALDFNKKRNSMCLGEGAAVFCLEAGVKENALAFIESVGYGTEKLEHNVSVTEEAECFQTSMKMAIKDIDGEIDVIVMHAPGTIKGDLSEMKAIEKVFGKEIPAFTSNKWKIGHTLGASGSLSMELAILMLQKQEFIGIPYLTDLKLPKKIERIMVNAVGFGGNAVSIVLKRN
ncbi:beta-ketoacyl synthase N-terminal-like domain-containing protein [Wenyingzhuangia sp. chi5]|uniref:Beta-ketoacyl synthase N-terminal-like domain-containing protein n=1 Tax=Wenyingzhuangia gilva TaxID=3057677 RepID=A0ABT8VU11_9FLAO|nr:beta-ketoacyl synthase N-terminal-like domain-containing protein [Wenyingzhuangia sp. chi5]MDO3695463.1 beta-ketoacyl synthase N-terminal-like domain-containing protein [Wenyingzhuangia sp. chi5]